LKYWKCRKSPPKSLCARCRRVHPIHQEADIVRTRAVHRELPIGAVTAWHHASGKRTRLAPGGLLLDRPDFEHGVDGGALSNLDLDIGCTYDLKPASAIRT